MTGTSARPFVFHWLAFRNYAVVIHQRNPKIVASGLLIHFDSLRGRTAEP